MPSVSIRGYAVSVVWKGIKPVTVKQMGRKRRTYNIDERIIAALAEMAEAKNASANRFLENILWDKAVAEGFIPAGERPLGETRGGPRSTKNKTAFPKG